MKSILVLSLAMCAYSGRVAPLIDGIGAWSVSGDGRLQRCDSRARNSVGGLFLGSPHAPLAALSAFGSAGAVRRRSALSRISCLDRKSICSIMMSWISVLADALVDAVAHAVAEGVEVERLDLGEVDVADW